MNLIPSPHALARTGAAAVGLGRAATGLVLMALPDRAAERWVGAATPATRYLVRAVGGRDLAVGAGVAASLLAGRPDAVLRWVLASVAGDAVDAVAALAMLDGSQRRQAVAMAGGFGLLGAVTAASVTAWRRTA